MIVYSLMDPKGTRFMLIFSLPLFLASLLAALAANAAFDGAFFLVSVGVPLVWSFVYSRSTNWFSTLSPAKPAWQFLVGAGSAQLAAVALLFWAVA